MKKAAISRLNLAGMFDVGYLILVMLECLQLDAGRFCAF